MFSTAEIRELGRAVDGGLRRIRSELPEACHYRIDGHAYADVKGATVQFEHAAPDTLRVVEPMSAYHPLLSALLKDPRLTEPAGSLIVAAQVGVFTDKLNLKSPGSGAFAWHQDSPYWAHACSHLDRLCNVMLALEDSDEENGCFRVQLASHRQGLLPGRSGEGRLGPLFTSAECIRADRELEVPLSAGSLFFFDPHLVHGSPPNLSARGRRALVLTYQPSGLPRFRGYSGRDA